MHRHVAKLLAALVGAIAGWLVYREVSQLWEGYIPPVVGGGIAVVVLVLLYFPLFRPVSDIAADRLAVAFKRSRHVRMGSGISDVPIHSPSVPGPVSCRLCGAPGLPICRECEKQMKKK